MNKICSNREVGEPSRASKEELKECLGQSNDLHSETPENLSSEKHL